MTMPLEAPARHPDEEDWRPDEEDAYLDEEDAPLEGLTPGEPPILDEIRRLLGIYGRSYAIFVGAVTAAALLAAFLLAPRYRATASLMAVGTGMPGGTLGRLARIANIAPSRDELPAETLGTILGSRRISDRILDAAFERWPGDPERIPFKNVLTRTRSGHEPPREKIYRKLAKATRFRIDPETRIVSLAVETRYPHLSAAVANAYLDELNRYATSEHQSKSRLMAEFMGRRIAEVQAEVGAEEKRLRDFLAQNRNYATSTDPDLRIEQLRLERNLELRARVLVELISNQEAALVEERNEAPLIQVIDHGAAPEMRSWPVRRLLVGGAAFGAAALGFVLMLVADTLEIRSGGDLRRFRALRFPPTGDVHPFARAR